MSKMGADDATIRLLNEQDIPVAAQLSAQVGWNQTHDDWRMLLRLGPENCFGVDADGCLVSTATLVTYGRELGWIGMVLTNPAYRRRGFARKLLVHAIDRADRLGIASLKLDATDQGQPLYETFGFRVEQPVQRWRRAVAATCTPQEIRATLDRHALELDRECVDADRSEMLQALARRSTVLCRPEGFCLSRTGCRARYLGPCLARNAGLAREFVQTLATGESYWDLLPQNQAAVQTAKDLGFTPVRQLLRMVRGHDRRGREDSLFGIAGFELG